MTKPTQRQPAPAEPRLLDTPAESPDEPASEVPSRSRRLFQLALLVWAGGFGLLLLLLMLESLPLLWDLLTLKFNQ